MIKQTLQAYTLKSQISSTSPTLRKPSNSEWQRREYKERYCVKNWISFYHTLCIFSLKGKERKGVWEFLSTEKERNGVEEWRRKRERQRESTSARHVSYKWGGVYVDQTVYLLRYVRGRGRGRWNRNGVGELERSRIALAIFIYIYSNVTSSVHVLRCDSNYASLCVGGPTYHTRHVAYVVCSFFFLIFFFVKFKIN